MGDQKQGTTGPKAAAVELEELIARTVLRDKKAFSELYQRTSAKLFGVCFRILNDRSEAEDVLQEIYIKIWHKADQFATGRASVVAWMATIARNQAIDRYRARSKPADDWTIIMIFKTICPIPNKQCFSFIKNEKSTSALRI